MVNELLRNRLVGKIEGALAEYHQAKALNHPLLTGRAREIAVTNLLTPLISSDFAIGNGKITDRENRYSAEMDIVVYCPRVLAPLLFSDQERFGIFPVECTAAAIEVKSTLSLSELRSSVEKMGGVASLQMTSGIYDDTGRGHTHEAKGVLRYLFAYGSDLSARDEFDRYKEADPNWHTNPALEVFCVVGKGAWAFCSAGRGEEARAWRSISASNQHGEVIFTLASLSNLLNYTIATRGYPHISKYLQHEALRKLDV